MSNETEMWAVHVQGPDDLHACPDRVVADALALLLNRQYARLPTGYPAMKAEVVPWPYSAEAWKNDAEQVRFAVIPRSESGLTQCDMHEDETW